MARAALCPQCRKIEPVAPFLLVMTQEHDTGYKLLFAHPEMVRDLLIGFVPEPWVQTLDFSTLERVNASYVSDVDGHVKMTHLGHRN
nr:Rpn family recombination-promoting nuclease/putative transposase [Hydrogenophilus thiooxidans]